jgi:hypothetical protein
MTKWPILLGCALLMPAAAGAQTIHGVVLEDEARTPIAGVQVDLLALDGTSVATAATDDEGEFLVRTRQAGRYTLRFTHIAFRTVHSDTLQLRSGEGVSVEARMAAAIIPVEPLVVTARTSAGMSGFHERRRRGGFGRYITRSDIETRPTMRTSDLLRTVPGVTVVPAGPGSNMILMRGGLGRCTPTIYIDGVPIRQFPGSGVDELLMPDFLEGVEIYTGLSAPAPIHSRGNCGVVAFWTRSSEGTGRWSWKKLGIAASAFLALVLLTRGL